MKLFKKKSENSKIIILGLYCLAYAVLAFMCALLLTIQFDNSHIAIVGFFGGILFFIYIYANYILTHRLLSFGVIFTIMLFFFCFGQFFLYGFGAKYDYFFLNSYYRQFFGNNDFYLLYGEVISILAIGLFQLAMLIPVKHKNRKDINNRFAFVMHESKTDINEPSVTNVALKSVSLILFLATFPIMLIYKLYLMTYSFSYGYAATGDLVQPLIVRFFGVFFIPAAIGLLVCSVHRKKRFLLLCVILSLYSCIGLITGGRTEPLILLASIGMLFLFNHKLKMPMVLLVLIVGYFAATLMVSVAEVRESNVVNISGFVVGFLNNLITFKTVVKLIGEMGFSGSSMIFTVYLVRSGQQELFFGATYIGAIANILPSSLDVFGILSGLDKFCHLESWLTETLGFSFGVGFNLIAEAYLNFGFGAILIMFFYGLLLNHIFSLNLKKGAWNLYKSLVMLAVLLTLPRRASLYFADQWMLCVIIIWLFCQIQMAFKRKRQRVLLNEVTY